ARLARALVTAGSIGTLATVYPFNESSPLSGHPFALMEYYAPCYLNGSLSFVLMGISKNAHHILASPTHAASITVQAPLSHSPVTKPRVALVGSVTVLGNDTAHADIQDIEECYLDRHPDSKFWLPGKSGFSDASWARFDPSAIYYVGGFGGQHFIGDIPLDLYQRSGGGVPPRNSALRSPLRIQHAQLASVEY
ncbi:hypothetical protein BS47DRAFT_1306170, partial [Hydnum rufescens UP504]